jgi:hypothetical protein
MVSVEPQGVFRELRGALQSQHLPAIAIELGNEPAPSRQTIAHVHRTVEVRVTAIAAGSGGYAMVDEPHVESFGRLQADQTLGGLAIELFEGPVVRDREDADRARLSITHTYQYRYRTTDGSIE